jgi:hypothetical protein
MNFISFHNILLLHLSGVQPGSLTQQLTTKNNQLPPEVLAKLMGDREESMGSVQKQFNSLFSKKGAQDKNLQIDLPGPKNNDSYTPLSNEEVIDIVDNSAKFRSQQDTTPRTPLKPPQNPSNAPTAAAYGNSQQTPTSNDLMAQTSTSGGMTMPATKAKPGKPASGQIPVN